MIIGLLVFTATGLFGMNLNQINTASKAVLMEISGVGEVKADAIIKERKNGKFKSFEDLQRVDGIGEQIAQNMRNNVKMRSDVKKIKTKKTSKSKTKSETKAKKSKSKKRKIKSMDGKKKELKTKAKKTKTKKTKAKKTKKTKSKKKN